jgi:hypothetical protein
MPSTQDAPAGHVTRPTTPAYVFSPQSTSTLPSHDAGVAAAHTPNPHCAPPLASTTHVSPTSNEPCAAQSTVMSSPAEHVSWCDPFMRTVDAVDARRLDEIVVEGVEEDESLFLTEDAAARRSVLNIARHEADAG